MHKRLLTYKGVHLRAVIFVPSNQNGNVVDEFKKNPKY
jgi:hypothetical protein